MGSEEIKRQIIEKILATKDSEVIEAIRSLLDINKGFDEDVPEDHLQILNERVEEYKRNPGSAISLEEFIGELKEEGKL